MRVSELITRLVGLVDEAQRYTPGAYLRPSPRVTVSVVHHVNNRLLLNNHNHTSEISDRTLQCLQSSPHFAQNSGSNRLKSAHLS